MRWLGPLALLPLFLACGSPPPHAASPPAAPPSLTPPRAPVDGWRSSSWEDRHATMTWGVLPVMGRKFQAFRHTEDPRLTCRTCHGSAAEARAYAMPNPDLAPLSAERLPRVDASPVARFMHEEVVPTMRELTEDPSLSCFSCHPHEGERRAR